MSAHAAFTTSGARPYSRHIDQEYKGPSSDPERGQGQDMNTPLRTAPAVCLAPSSFLAASLRSLFAVPLQMMVLLVNAGLLGLAATYLHLGFRYEPAET